MTAVCTGLYMHFADDENGMPLEGAFMITKRIENFDLAQICRSGQCFRMDALEDGAFSVIAGDRYLRLRQQGRDCSFACSEEEFEQFWKRYFDLEQDYGAYLGRVDCRDGYLSAAASYGNGIRILRQDLWEMIVSFLLSQQNNIVRIRRCIRNICEAYGEKRQNTDGESYYAFPKPEALAGLEEDALKPCNLGYRSKYVVRAARQVLLKEIDLEAAAKLPYPEAKRELMKLYGVGEKVADCICLFALHQLEAFPVDTHINQALQKHYGQGFPQQRYQGIQGVMQQYIFFYELFGTKAERETASGRR